MQEPIHHLAPDRPDRRAIRLLWVFVVLCLALVSPYLAGQIQYSMTRATLRARSEAAAQELKELDKNAELVKLADTSKAFRLVARKIEPSVVHIDTVQAVEVKRGAFDEWGFHFSPSQRLQQGQGSGVIVDAEAGYVLTNYHVIHGASSVQVNLSDGRTIGDSDVEIVGYDVATDLAVLRLRAGDLLAAPWGDSRELEVGDWVLAVGNPYGLDRTVTSGIVSAKQRRGFVHNNAFQNFLQTDAAVNPGNSGGPLVNIRGELIGITTAIIGQAFQGISFAIPSEIAQKVYEQLKTSGKVARGWLGVQLQALTPELAKRFGVVEGRGALVAGVVRGSPADKAGLQPTDVIVEFNGQKLNKSAELPLLVAGAKIGSTVKLGVLRGGQMETIEVTLEERPSDPERRR